MTCPNCGLLPLEDQRFCRSCGASLRLTAERWTGSLLWGLIIMLIGAGIGILGKKLVHNDIVTVVGVLISLAGMFLVAYPYLVRPQGYKPSRHSQPEVLTPSQPTKSLPQGSNTEYVPSITEKTTDLLMNSVAPAPAKKENGEVEGPDKGSEKL